MSARSFRDASDAGRAYHDFMRRKNSKCLSAMAMAMRASESTDIPVLVSSASIESIDQVIDETMCSGEWFLSEDGDEEEEAAAAPQAKAPPCAEASASSSGLLAISQVVARTNSTTLPDSCASPRSSVAETPRAGGSAAAGSEAHGAAGRTLRTSKSDITSEVQGPSKSDFSAEARPTQSSRSGGVLASLRRVGDRCRAVCSAATPRTRAAEDHAFEADATTTACARAGIPHRSADGVAAPPGRPRGDVSEGSPSTEFFTLVPRQRDAAEQHATRPASGGSMSWLRSSRGARTSSARIIPAEQ